MGCDELTILKLKIEIINRSKVDTLGGPLARNTPMKRIILVIVIVVRVILVGFDAFFFNFIK